MLAPICLFTYNRLKETQQTVEALILNNLAQESELIVFSDGPKNDEDITKVEEVRLYLHSVSGLKSVEIIESPVNKGLANSVISGVTQIIEQFGKVIVLEDDLITSPNFLDYMNQALFFYQDRKRVLSVSGFSFSINYSSNYQYDIELGYRASSWGWATWNDRWNGIDWEIKDYYSFKWNSLKRLKFNRGGSDMAHMLDRQMNGQINSWAIRFCYHQFKHDLLDVFPIKSKVINNGFSPNGTNCKFETKRFKTILDTSGKRYFRFNDELNVNKDVIKEFYQHYSFATRFFDKIRQFLWAKRN